MIKSTIPSAIAALLTDHSGDTETVEFAPTPLHVSAVDGVDTPVASRRTRRHDAARLAGGEQMDRKEAVAVEKQLSDLEGTFLTRHREVTEWMKKAQEEIKSSVSMSTETKNAIEKAVTSANEAADLIQKLAKRLDTVEAKEQRHQEGMKVKSLGDQFIESDAYKAMGPMGSAKSSARMEIKNIVNATGQNQPLVPDMRVPGIQYLPNRILRIRQLLPVGQTSSNLVQFVQELLFSNAAGPQVGGSPTVAGEGNLKNQSDLTFQLQNAPVVTLAHWMLASTQVLDDAPMLASYINARLQYGLALEEDNEILNGDGTVGTLNGLMNQATGLNRLGGTTEIDVLRKAITQLQLSEYSAEFVVLNPAQWENIELTKDSQGRYIIANPQSLLGPQIWGLPVIATNSMRQGQFLVGNGTMAAQIWDRQQSAVLLSREDSDNFRRNMVTLLCEERLALTVYRPSALIKGTFSV